jgi:hypothetical protein
MKPDLNKWTLVLAGRWNQHILTPAWVGKNIFGTPKIEIETMIGPTVGGVRYTTPNVRLIPSDVNLVVAARRADDETLECMEEVALKLLEFLPHTPLNAYGINFGFRREELGEGLASVFRLSDVGELTSAGASILGTEISRALQFADSKEILNLKFTVERDTGGLVAHLNYHNQVGSAEDARKLLKGSLVDRKKRTLALLRDVYKMEIEEEAEEHDEPARVGGE